MTIQSAILNLLMFPQRWVPQPEAGVDPFLELRILVIPKGDPRANFNAVAVPFADAALEFEAAIVPSLAALPTPGAVVQRVPLAIAQPLNRRPLFAALANAFNIRVQPPPGPPVAPPAVRKFLTYTYRDATRRASPRTRFVVTDDSYECALKNSKPKTPPPQTPDDRLIWEEVLAFALRQPVLARELGLIYETVLPLPGANPFAQGGYLFVDLAADSAYRAEVTAQPALLARYAARIPPLNGIMEERPVFAAVLFPVTGGGQFDEVFVEAGEYDEGFARIVHGGQPRRSAQVEHGPDPLQPGEIPPPRDVGLRLAWDDEQITIWHNRQFGVNAYNPAQPAPDSPLGVAGYRVDVREDLPDQPWRSLSLVTGNLTLGGIDLGVFNGELAVEAVPVNLTFDEKDGFWLPSYFTAWTGGSLVLADPLAYRIANQPNAIPPPVYTAVDADSVLLRYGHTYQFRVRLMDLTGGGPHAGDFSSHKAPAPVAVIPFRRFVPPKAVTVDSGGGLEPDHRTATYSVRRPLLGYPDLVFTGFNQAVDLLLAEAPDAAAAERETALPDPDASHLQIEVQVRTLDHDPATAGSNDRPYLTLYSVLREFPPDPVQPFILNARFEDLPQAGALNGAAIGDGDPLRLPSSRDVRLVLKAIGSTDPGLAYWGSQEARQGAAVNLYLRAPSVDERQLLRPALDGPEIQAIFLQPDPPPNPNLRAQFAMAGLRHEAPSDLADRFATQLRLGRSGLSFNAPAGRRFVFGASPGLRHTLNPDHSSIAIGSTSDLTRHWIVAIRLTIDRDWTWDGLAPAAFDVRRDGINIGQIALPRAVNAGVGTAPDRNHTELLFLDAYDPKPKAFEFPRESHLRYELVPNFKEPPGRSDAAGPWELTLPITTPPAQTPKLVSAGLASSPYEHDERYASTGERRRMLYFEFDRKPDDERDRYFARVLVYGPDPMLIPDTIGIPQHGESPLPVDPEPIRVVTLDSANDRAGLDAMQELTAAPDQIRYLLPLPSGMDPDAPELFGFFVYEVRVGHDDSRWSTAQGRFGFPLRVTGVQHPAPQLRCSVSRAEDRITVTAPYAAPVFDGVNIRPFPPKTTLQGLLYVQVMQADAQTWRNVLLHTADASPQRLLRERRDLRFIQGVIVFPQDEVQQRLALLGLPLDSALSVIAVELLPEPNSPTTQPLGSELGEVRIYRTSPLTPVPAICPPMVDGV